MTRIRHGFTLIELLVVISIISLLIAILLPALQSARDVAKDIQCLSNQRQVGIALVAYSTDHDGYLPAAWDASVSPAVDWSTNLSRYMTNRQGDWSVSHEEQLIAMSCPSAMIDRGVLHYAPNFLIMAEQPWAMNPAWYDLPYAYRLDQAKRASKVMSISDACQSVSGNSSLSLHDLNAGTNNHRNHYYDPSDPDNNDPIDPGPNEDLGYRNLRWRHSSGGKEPGSVGGAVNVLFLDGHASTVKEGALLNENIRADG